KSSIAGSGSGLMSWRTISDSVSDGVLTMSRKSFGTHWRLAPPMITIRGAIAPPRLRLPRARNLTPASGMLPSTPSDGVVGGSIRPALRHEREWLGGLYDVERHHLMESLVGSGELREPGGGGLEH